MKSLHYAIVFTIILCTFSCKEEPLTGSQLLDKAIAYHDPNNNWANFDGRFNVLMQTPNSDDRLSKLHINISLEYFSLEASQGEVNYSFTINKNKCVTSSMDVGAIKKFGLESKEKECERFMMYKNYYTYLYGLPMKLKDPGTHIDPIVATKTFKGKEYLVLKATYDKTVGSDIWYFYFNPNTYAMEIYQFFKTDENGAHKDDSGEYILLTEEALVNDIKMPKERAWYYNKDDKYLGTDIIE
jgi:hypothetical protein